MSEETQGFKNHARFDPLYHFFLTFVLLANIVISIVFCVKHPGFYSAWIIVLSVSLLLALFKLRGYPLKVQDRVIRLEERLRLQALLSAEMSARIGELTESQLVALRFASDNELPALVEKTLAAKMKSKDIKQAIVTWRADTFRV